MEDRLPETNVAVIAIDEYDNICSAVLGDDGYYYDGDGYWAKITHWMPLPELPKPKEQTFKDVFLKAFPKAIMYNDGIPLSCRASVFGGKCSLGSTKCFECWNQSYFDEEEEGEGDA